MFATQYVREERLPEVNKGKSMVEKAGYIPAKVKIEQIMLAGRRMKEYREEQFDYKTVKEVDYENVETDRTRSGNYDIADATQDLLEVREKIRNRVLEERRNKEMQQKDEVEQKMDEKEGVSGKSNND